VRIGHLTFSALTKNWDYQVIYDQCSFLSFLFRKAPSMLWGQAALQAKKSTGAMTSKPQLRMSPRLHREQARLIRNASGSEEMAVHHEMLAQIIESRLAEYANHSTTPSLRRPRAGRTLSWRAWWAHSIWALRVARMLHTAPDSG
jgi:hypothetical protein